MNGADFLRSLFIKQHIGCIQDSILCIKDREHVEVFLHAFLKQNGRIFVQFLRAERAACFVYVSTASADTFSEESGQFVGMNFFRAGTNGELDFIRADILSEAYIDFIGLQRKVTDDAENVRIARLGS